MYHEVNLDSLIGPTHHYGGLAYGNVASMTSKYLASNPKKAALQGLDKMLLLHTLGVPQCIIPPQIRPHLDSIKTMDDIKELSSAYSSSYMWMANAGHFTPDCDSLDHRIHFTPSNFASQFHRQSECAGHQKMMSTLIQKAIIHNPISSKFSDEGAANDVRLCSKEFKRGITLFVYGASIYDLETTKYPCRQTKEAYIELCERHRYNINNVVFAKQHPSAIDSGVFHNDVISVGHKNILLCHDYSFENQNDLLVEVRHKFETYVEDSLFVHVISNKHISLKECVDSYLFNSQLVDTPEGVVMIAPKQCEWNEKIKSYIDDVLLNETPIKKCLFIDLQESMRNGGGPACLRLKMVLSDQDYHLIEPRYKVTGSMINDLKSIVNSLYPEHVTVSNLLTDSFLRQVKESYSVVLKYFRDIKCS